MFNGVTAKVEFCKCLRRDRLVMSDINRRVTVKLPYSVVKREQDVEHLHLQWT